MWASLKEGLVRKIVRAAKKKSAKVLLRVYEGQNSSIVNCSCTARPCLIKFTVAAMAGKLWWDRRLVPPPGTRVGAIRHTAGMSTCFNLTFDRDTNVP